MFEQNYNIFVSNLLTITLTENPAGCLQKSEKYIHPSTYSFVFQLNLKSQIY